ncbi:unnamed protein product, partial [Prorocentrum cordatum]
RHAGARRGRAPGCAPGAVARRRRGRGDGGAAREEVAGPSQPQRRAAGGGLGRRPPGRAAHPRAGGPGRRGGRCAGIGGLPPHGAGGGRGGREAVRLPRARWRDAARGPPRGMQVSDGVPLRPPARGRKARQRRGHGQAGLDPNGAFGDFVGRSRFDFVLR